MYVNKIPIYERYGIFFFHIVVLYDQIEFWDI